MNNHDFIGFVPQHLEIEGRPELNNFPLNVLFVSPTILIKDGVKHMASALYNPDVPSFKAEDTKYSMEYRNAYGGNSWLRITYDADKKNYAGEKFINDQSTGMAFGVRWQGFFIHLTMIGLSKGEECMFEPME